MSCPPPPFTHLRRLTDEGGLYEHAKGTTPRREHGYCLDDVARALVVVSREPEATLDDLRRQYLSFVLAAQAGDPVALEVFDVVARRLGQGLALLVDILNPQRIVIGSIWSRQRSLLEPVTLRVLQEEALPLALSVCQVVPAGLGESVGDLASLSVALNALRTAG